MTDIFVAIGLNKLSLFWNVEQCLRRKFLNLKRSSIGWKKFQWVHSEPFLTDYELFEEFQHWSNFYFLWPTLLSELVQMNCTSCERVANIVQRSLFTWNYLALAAKSSKESSPNLFWQNLSVLRNFSIGQTSFFTTHPSFQIGSNELCLLWKGDKYCRENVLYLKGSSIGWRKFQKVQLKPFLTNFQLFEEF